MERERRRRSDGNEGEQLEAEKTDEEEQASAQQYQRTEQKEEESKQKVAQARARVREASETWRPGGTRCRAGATADLAARGAALCIWFARRGSPRELGHTVDVIGEDMVGDWRQLSNNRTRCER